MCWQCTMQKNEVRGKRVPMLLAHARERHTRMRRPPTTGCITAPPAPCRLLRMCCFCKCDVVSQRPQEKNSRKSYVRQRQQIYINNKKEKKARQRHKPVRKCGKAVASAPLCKCDVVSQRQEKTVGKDTHNTDNKYTSYTSQTRRKRKQDKDTNLRGNAEQVK